MQRTCVTIYGPEAGKEIERLIEAATGEHCPCRRNLPCPLLDERGFNPLALVTPAPPAA